MRCFKINTRDMYMLKYSSIILNILIKVKKYIVAYILLCLSSNFSTIVQSLCRTQKRPVFTFPTKFYVGKFGLSFP